MEKYTNEQIEDITTREKKALEMLREMQVTPAAFIQKVGMRTQEGTEVFADQLTPYLRDTKYTRKSDGTYEENAKKN